LPLLALPVRYNIYQKYKTMIYAKFVTWMHSFHLIFLWFIYQNVRKELRTQIRVIAKRSHAKQCDIAWPFNSENWYKWFLAWSHTISHLGRWLLHGSLRVIKLQPNYMFDAIYPIKSWGLNIFVLFITLIRITVKYK
jgi:hypothetical protein